LTLRVVCGTLASDGTVRWRINTSLGWRARGSMAVPRPRQKASRSYPSSWRTSDARSRIGSKVPEENRTKLGELIGTVGSRLLYEYDFGDGWQHELLLEEVLLGDETFPQTCVAGQRCCPPKTVGERRDLQSFSKRARTPLTLITLRPGLGLAILFLNPSRQMTLTDDYAAGNTDDRQTPGRGA
jgi:hypothetical protein